MSNNNIGSNIRLYRTENGVSREEIAEKLSVSLAAISAWETGASVPDGKRIFQLCELLDITPNMLYGLPDEVWKEGLDEYEQSIISGYRTATMAVRAEMLKLSQQTSPELAAKDVPFLPASDSNYTKNIKKGKALKAKKRLSGMSLTDIYAAIDAKYPSLGCCLSDAMLLQVINGERCASTALLDAFYDALRPALREKGLDVLDKFSKVYLTVCIVRANR